MEEEQVPEGESKEYCVTTLVYSDDEEESEGDEEGEMIDLANLPPEQLQQLLQEHPELAQQFLMAEDFDEDEDEDEEYEDYSEGEDDEGESQEIPMEPTDEVTSVRSRY